MKHSLKEFIEKIMNGFVVFYEHEYEEIISDPVIQSRLGDDTEE